MSDQRDEPRRVAGRIWASIDATDLAFAELLVALVAVTAGLYLLVAVAAV